MRKQAGQALILVLILLGIGALLVVPSLRLTGTALMNSPIVERQIKGLYAADAAQEYILWKLLWGDLAGDLMESYDPEYPDDPPSVHYDLDVCGVPAGVTVYMRAEEGKGGMVLATDDKIRPTKTVDCGGLGSTITDDWSGTVTYTIRLEQLSEDTSQGLAVIYDILPKCFEAIDFESGSCRLKVDGVDLGEFPDPLIETGGEHAWGGQIRLRWPNPETYPFSDNFTSDPVFKGMGDFSGRQVNELSFEMTNTFSGDEKGSTHCNWVVLKMEDGTNTLSGPQAPIAVGG